MVLQEVPVPRGALGQQRDGVLGIVVLRQDHDSGAWMALADLFRRINALPVERGGHSDVRHQHMGLEVEGTLDHFVVVGCHPDHVQVVVARDQRPDTLPDDQVVVGQKDGDRARRGGGAGTRVGKIHRI
jgi:hypothetical protein